MFGLAVQNTEEVKARLLKNTRRSLNNIAIEDHLLNSIQNLQERLTEQFAVPKSGAVSQDWGRWSWSYPILDFDWDTLRAPGQRKYWLGH